MGWMPPRRALWARSGVTPFQSPDWLLPWMEAFGVTRPLVATMRRDGVLVGVLATYVLESEAKLLPIGAGACHVENKRFPVIDVASGQTGIDE